MTSSENLLVNFDKEVNGSYKSADIVLKPCRICGRTFNPQSLERHEQVCEKTKKRIGRNVFNSFSQRAKDIGVIPVLNEEKEKKKCRKGKEENENLRNVRRDKNLNSNIMNNGSSQQQSLPLGYQQCPSCSRCFNQKAAERHIAWCLEQQTRMPKTPPSSEALERLKARVKYKAPLPKRRLNTDSSIRLVKSAESMREPSLVRTRSSPSIQVHHTRNVRETKENLNVLTVRSSSQNIYDKNLSDCSSSNSHQHSSNSNPEVQNKKAVKFKEIFPVYKKTRNKNLDMLAALRLRLSELETSDDYLDDCLMKPNENDMSGYQPKQKNVPSSTPFSREIWTSDGEKHCSSSSSSSGSLPCLNDARSSSEQRMPRFCYNCGTKYPIISAKFCCECGARRFVINDCSGPLYAV